ncbi:unnamed protein product [Natator depressus]
MTSCSPGGTFLGPGLGADMGQSESKPQDEQEDAALTAVLPNLKLFVEDQLQTSMVLSVMIGVGVSMLLIASLIVVLVHRLHHKKVQAQEMPKYQFRKRDEVQF